MRLELGKCSKGRRRREGNRVDVLSHLLHGMWLGRVFVGGNLESLEDPVVGYLCGFLVVYLPGLLTGTSYNLAEGFCPRKWREQHGVCGPVAYQVFWQASVVFCVGTQRVEKVSWWVTCSVLVFYIFKLSLNLRPSITAIKNTKCVCQKLKVSTMVSSGSSQDVT